MSCEEARATLSEKLRELRRSYDIHEGRSGDTERRRITLLVCDLILELEPDVDSLLLGRRKVSNWCHTLDLAQGVSALMVTGYGNAGFEKALYDALQEYNFECDAVPAESDWRAAKAKARGEGQRDKLRALQYNPLKLHFDDGHQPLRPYSQAVEAFPVIDAVIEALLGNTPSDERKSDAREKGTSARPDMEERLERRRVA